MRKIIISILLCVVLAGCVCVINYVPNATRPVSISSQAYKHEQNQTGTNNTIREEFARDAVGAKLVGAEADFSNIGNNNGNNNAAFAGLKANVTSNTVSVGTNAEGKVKL
jgi:hypothetical protein